MKMGLTVLIALILALGALSNTYAAGYTYTPLNYPGALMSAAQGINSAGTIVGGYSLDGSVQYGFSLSGGTYTSLGGYPGAEYTEANGINDAGTIIVGGYGLPLASNNDRGFSLSGGTYTSLQYPGTSENWVTGINNAGTIIVGWYIDANNNDHGYSLSNGAYTLLSGYPGASDTDATGVNNAGTIVGYWDASSGSTSWLLHHGFVLSNGTYTSLDAPGANLNVNGTQTGTWAEGINDAGAIVGYYVDGNGVTHGFVLSGTTYTTLDYPGASSTYNSSFKFVGTKAYGINNAGTIVGQYTDASGVIHGFLATPGSNPPSFTLTVVNSGAGSGTVTSTPAGINCGSTCSASYSSGTVVTLTATPNSASTFTGWSGACQNASGTCVVTMSAAEAVTAHYSITGTTSSILWRNISTGADVVWYMNGATMTSYAALSTVTDQTWTIVGTGDFNGDGNPDILWRNISTGANVVWYMNGATMTSWASVTPTVTDQTWIVVGVGDFNGDGKPDILWRNTSTGADVVWYMNGATMTTYAALSAVTDQTWTIVGVGDLNSDGKPDILWRNTSTGADVVWYMNGATMTSWVSITPAVTDQTWEIAGVLHN